MEIDITTENILVFKRARCGKFGGDHKGPFLYDDANINVICQGCEKEVSPIYVLRLIDRNIEYLKKMREEIKIDREVLDKRKRFKCRDCGKINRLR